MKGGRGNLGAYHATPGTGDQVERNGFGNQIRGTGSTKKGTSSNLDSGWEAELLMMTENHMKLKDIYLLVFTGEA
ncbi:MAG: hypothetical protein ACQET7_15920 [Thermodesulfobacteriota bacterium]